jgi:spermidine synthase
MNSASETQSNTESALWLNNLVDGLSGLTIKVKHTLYCESSPFQKIEVFDTYGYGRILLLGGTIVFTERDEHIYNEMITHPAMVTHAKPQKVCVIGGGDGGVLREVLKHPAVKSVTVVEIDKQVTEVVKRLFPGLAQGFGDRRVELAFDDGHDWLEENKRAFDIIIVDSYDPAGPVQSLETANFFELVRASLRTGGMAVFQTNAPELYREKIRRMSVDLSVHFPWRTPYVAPMPSFPLGLSSFALCGAWGKGPAVPAAARLAALSARCRYYSSEIHTGAFCLPKSVAEILR